MLRMIIIVYHAKKQSMLLYAGHHVRVYAQDMFGRDLVVVLLPVYALLPSWPVFVLVMLLPGKLVAV